MISTGTDLDLDILEDLLNDECKCESRHNYVECSYTVTHRIVTCTMNLLVCFNTAKNTIERKNNRVICGDGCCRRASECWSIRPV